MVGLAEKQSRRRQRWTEKREESVCGGKIKIKIKIKEKKGAKGWAEKNDDWLFVFYPKSQTHNAHRIGMVFVLSNDISTPTLQL